MKISLYENVINPTIFFGKFCFATETQEMIETVLSHSFTGKVCGVFVNDSLQRFIHTFDFAFHVRALLHSP